MAGQPRKGRVFCVKVDKLQRHLYGKNRPSIVDSLRFFHMGIKVQLDYEINPGLIMSGPETETIWCANIFCRGILGHAHLNRQLPEVQAVSDLSVNLRILDEEIGRVGRIIHLLIETGMKTTGDVLIFSQLEHEFEQTIEAIAMHVAHKPQRMVIADADGVRNPFDVAVLHTVNAKLVAVDFYTHPISSNRYPFYDLDDAGDDSPQK